MTVTWFIFHMSEPSNRGRSLSAWLEIYCSSDDQLAREEAASAIRGLGRMQSLNLMAHFDYETPGWMCGLERRVLRDRADLEDHLRGAAAMAVQPEVTSAAEQAGEVRERGDADGFRATAGPHEIGLIATSSSFAEEFPCFACSAALTVLAAFVLPPASAQDQAAKAQTVRPRSASPCRARSIC